MELLVANCSAPKASAVSPPLLGPLEGNVRALFQNSRGKSASAADAET